MTNSEIIRDLALRLSVSQVEVKDLMKESIRIIRETLDKDMDVSITELGTFSTHLAKKRKSYDPFNKRFLMLPPIRILRFRPGSSMKNELKSKKF